MNKKELVKLLEENFGDDTDVVFYLRESDTCHKVDSVAGLYVDYLGSGVIALEG